MSFLLALPAAEYDMCVTSITFDMHSVTAGDGPATRVHPFHRQMTRAHGTRDKVSAPRAPCPRTE